MKPATKSPTSRFPTLGGSARWLSVQAETESLDTYKKNIPKYRENNYRYIPLPRSAQYYDCEIESLHEITPKQYVDSSDDFRTIFRRLTDEPFLLQDMAESLEVYVVDKDEFYLLPEDAVTKDADEIESEHPGIADELANVKDNRYRIITIADLNRRIVGEQLYPIIAELEEQIAEAIEEDVDNPEKMYHNVPEHIVGRREKDILNDIEVHTAEYLGLGEMIGFLKGRGHLWNRFGFDSANDCGDRLSSIKELRNRVMHSNRTLIRSRGDVGKTLERVNDAQKIIATAQGIPLKNVEELYW